MACWKSRSVKVDKALLVSGSDEQCRPETTDQSVIFDTQANLKSNVHCHDMLPRQQSIMHTVTTRIMVQPKCSIHDQL